MCRCPKVSLSHLLREYNDLCPRNIPEQGGEPLYSLIQQILNACSVPGTDPTKIQAQLEESLSIWDENTLRRGLSAEQQSGAGQGKAAQRGNFKKWWED